MATIGISDVGRPTRSRGKTMKMPIVIVTACACLGSFATLSQEHKTVTVLGAGNRSCGSWTQARRAGGVLTDTYQSWVAGFLSGSNSVIATDDLKIDILEGQAKLGDAQGIYAAIDNYCQSHPLNSIAEAADVVGGELIRRSGSAK
jgi:hypothetical protein